MALLCSMRHNPGGEQSGRGRRCGGGGGCWVGVAWEGDWQGEGSNAGGRLRAGLLLAAPQAAGLLLVADAHLLGDVHQGAGHRQACRNIRTRTSMNAQTREKISDSRRSCSICHKWADRGGEDRTSALGPCWSGG